jgi:branched-chain amino acid transport system permease protein
MYQNTAGLRHKGKPRHDGKGGGTGEGGRAGGKPLSYDMLFNAVADIFDAIGVPLNANTPGRLLNAVTDGVMYGGYYAALTVGVSISFGILDIVNIAHPAFIILGAYVAYYANSQFGLDPILASVLALPFFYGLGALLYQVYHLSFEKRGPGSSGQDASGQDSLRGLAFFFGILFITEVALILQFGPDFRSVNASYINETWHVGAVGLSLRKLVPFAVSLAMLAALQLYLTRTFTGRAIMAVAQDQFALRLMGADPVRVKRAAFAISIATASLAGAFLIIVQLTVVPSMGPEYIGLVFAICVLGGLGSLTGTLIAAMLLGIAQSFTESFYGPSWAPAVSFGLLLLTLAFRPSGIMGR